MNKKSKWWLALACACVSLGLATGCNSNREKPTNNGQTTKIELNIVRESVELELFQEYDLQYNYTGESNLSWSVEDSSVVTVSNGKLVALKAGKTTVSVQAGGLSDVCEVKVNGVKSELLNVFVKHSQISLYAGESCTLAPTLTYGEKTLEATNFSYESSDMAIVSVSSSGVLTANSVGQTSVSITATALQASVGCIVNVTVKESGNISINTMQTELYALAEYKGKTYQNQTQLQATVTEKGEPKDSATVVWTSSDKSVATVQNGKVVAVGLGEAKITATYTDADGNSVEAVSFVTVIPVAHTVETTVDVVKTQPFSTDEWKTESANAYVTDGVLPVSVPVSSGDALDFSEIDFVGKATLVLDEGSVLIYQPVYLWTDAISTVNGLAAIRTATDGHYRLETDLDLTGVAWNYGETTVVFKGVFDGCNHTLTNFAPTSCGLFYGLGGEAKVQNLNFKNATLGSSNKAVGCLAAVIEAGASVQVEHITGNILNNGNACGGLFGRVATNAEVTLKNNELHVYTLNTKSGGGAIVGCADSAFIFPSNAASVIYSNISLCGNAVYTGFNNSARESINDYKAVKPTAYKEVLDKWNDLAGTKIEITEANVAKATLFGKTVEEIAFNNGFTLTQEQVGDFTGNNLELMLEKTDGKIAYYAISLEYGDIKLTNKNKHLLKRAESGTIILQEDIDLSGETWVSTITFTGTLDGNGYAIKNLTTSVNSNENGYQGLFKYLGEGAIIKNVAFIDVVMGANSGVVAGQIYGSSKAKVENVFIQVKKTGNATTSARYGIVERTNDGSLDLTNVVVKMPGVSQNETLLGHNTKAKCTLTNVHGISISPTNKIAIGTSVVPLQKDCGLYADLTAFNAAQKTLTEFLAKCVANYLK